MPTARELVQRLHEEVWKRRNYTLLDEVCSPDCKFYDPLQGDRPTDLAQYKQLMAQFDRSFAIDEVRVDRIVEAGDVAVFLWRLTVHMRGEEEASGKTGQTSGMGLVQIRGGKVVEHRSTWDTLRFFQGLGLVPALALPGVKAQQPPAQPRT